MAIGTAAGVERLTEALLEAIDLNRLDLVPKLIAAGANAKVRDPSTHHQAATLVLTKTHVEKEQAVSALHSLFEVHWPVTILGICLTCIYV